MQSTLCTVYCAIIVYHFVEHMELCFPCHVKASKVEYSGETDKDGEVCNAQSLKEGKSERIWHDQQYI